MKAAAFKTADYLKTEKDIVAYLNAALEDGEPAVLLEALRNVAQAKGGYGSACEGGRGQPREPLPHSFALWQSQDRDNHGASERPRTQAHDRAAQGGVTIFLLFLWPPAGSLFRPTPSRWRGGASSRVWQTAYG